MPFIFYFIFLLFFYFLTLQYYISFPIYQHESATCMALLLFLPSQYILGFTYFILLIFLN